MILVLRAGPETLDARLFDGDLAPGLGAEVSGIGGEAALTVEGMRAPAEAPDHGAALDLLLTGLEDRGQPLHLLQAAAHRIAHGGPNLTGPKQLTPDVLDEIAALRPLAPAEIPPALATITALGTRMPELPQLASFDTAFHATQPEVASTFALPEGLRSSGMRRYGSHGLSFAALVDHFGPEIPPRLLAVHLGETTGACAILHGRSVASASGYAPQSGPPGARHGGDLDPALVLRLSEELGPQAAGELLRTEGGLLALAGTADPAELVARDDEAARFALAHVCYWTARHAAGLAVAMGGADALAVTGEALEETAPLRREIAAHLDFLGPLETHAVPSGEARQIAREALSLLAPSSSSA